MHSREQPRRVAYEISEDELKARPFVLGEHIQCFAIALETAVGGTDMDVDDRRITNAQIGFDGFLFGNIISDGGSLLPGNRGVGSLTINGSLNSDQNDANQNAATALYVESFM